MRIIKGSTLLVITGVATAAMVFGVPWMNGQRTATTVPSVTVASPAGSAPGMTPAAPPKPSLEAAPPVRGGLWAKPPIGKTWQEYFGLTLEATLDAAGPTALHPKPGQVYFYTTAGTSWGATNTRNSIAIFDVTDMKHWKHVATTNLPDEYVLGYSSHGLAVSADGRWLYLPSMANPEKPSRLIVIDGQTLKPYKVYRESFPGTGGHHLNNFTGPDGREYIMSTDFGWNFGGAGGWVIDPAKDQAIVGGMHRFDLSGHPYVFSMDVQGKLMYATVPAPTAALRGKMDGMLVKIDMAKWKVLGAVPILDPIWPEVTQDGKFAWVTEGDGQKVKKVDLGTMEIVAEVSTGPGPWGARLSCDESKLYVADKGESAGYGQQGRTMTIIDTRYNIVTNVVPIGRTTDHILISPDCKYVIANSNADHDLWIYDAETEKLVSVVKIPNDGDPHGGTFVRWLSDGKGGVRGEVVSTVAGLRGSARQAQQALIKATEAAIPVRINPRNAFARIPTSFAPETITVTAGSPVSLMFNYAAGTSGPTLKIEGKAVGIQTFELQPGQRRLIQFKAPAAAGPAEVSVLGDPKARPLRISVGPPKAVAPGPAVFTASLAGIHEVKLVGTNRQWSIKALTVKPGEKVSFTILNQDDEKHDLINPQLGLLPPESPDVDPGRSTTFTWTVPNAPGHYKFTCLYHPAMVIDVTIK